MKLLRSSLHNRLWLGLIWLPVLIFFAFFFYYRLDIPWFDDFESIPYFLAQFNKGNTLAEKATALLRPNNEHRLIYARLVVLLYTWLTGTISFNTLMLIGNLGLVVIFGLFVAAARRQKLPVAFLLPVALILFHPQPYLMTFTALFSLQYLAIIMLVMLALYVLAFNGWRSFWGALLLGVFCTFSMGNGMLVWAAGSVVLFYQKQWARLGIWVSVALLAVFGYFYGYPVQQGNESGFAFLKEHLFLTIRGFFTYAGSLFDLFPAWPDTLRSIMPALAGVAIVGFLVFWLIRLVLLRAEAPSHWNNFLLGVIVFLLLNTAIIAVFRIRFGFGMVLWPSYRAYIMVLGAAAYLVLINYVSERHQQRWFPAILIVALGVNVLSYITYTPEVINWQKQKQGLAYNQQYNNMGLGGSIDYQYLADFIDVEMKRMKTEGWYEMPTPVIMPGEQQLRQPIPLVQPAAVKQTQITNEPDYVLVETYEGEYRPSRHHAIYVVLKSPERAYVTYALPRKPAIRNPFQPLPGFWAAVPKGMVQPGRYRLGLFTENGDKGELQYLNQYVEVEPRRAVR